jgi:hypothetical protein
VLFEERQKKVQECVMSTFSLDFVSAAFSLMLQKALNLDIYGEGRYAVGFNSSQRKGF